MRGDTEFEKGSSSPCPTLTKSQTRYIRVVKVSRTLTPQAVEPGAVIYPEVPFRQSAQTLRPWDCQAFCSEAW